MPQKFASLLRISLGKLVGSGDLDPNLVNLDFWVNLPKKFQAIHNYDEGKKKKKMAKEAAAASMADLVMLQFCVLCVTITLS